MEPTCFPSTFGNRSLRPGQFEMQEDKEGMIATPKQNYSASPYMFKDIKISPIQNLESAMENAKDSSGDYVQPFQDNQFQDAEHEVDEFRLNDQLDIEQERTIYETQSEISKPNLKKNMKGALS